MFRRVIFGLCVALLGVFLSACPAKSQPVPTPKVSKRPLPTTFMRGMTLSCPTWGPIWGRPETGVAMDGAKALGSDWVAIHPYGNVERSGIIRWLPTPQAAFLAKAAEMAKARKLKMLWKPHLAYWGQFKWRGTIAFDTEDAWKVFFSEYTAFIVDQAQAAERFGAEMFVVGLEYEATVHREADWRRVIDAVRAVYNGPIVYAANWDGINKVPFWDAVDVIGVQMYAPLAPKSPLTSPPSDEQLALGWEQAMQQLRALSKRHHKPLLFAEIGYAASEEAASAPWKPGTDPKASVLRTRLMRQALEKMEREDMLIGAFWWKWMPGPKTRYDTDYSMKDPEAQLVLKESWVVRPPRTLKPLGPKPAAPTPKAAGAQTR